MKPAKIKAMLWRLGHFSNPLMPTHIEESDLDSLTLTDDDVQNAIHSYQNFMAGDFDRLANQHHGRYGIADGLVGPATKDLFSVKRCGYPDYGPDVEAATGSGSWPAGCHPDWPDNHSFTVSINNNPPSYLGSIGDPNSPIEQAWELCRLSYADMGCVYIREDGNANANTQVTFVRGRGWIGLAIVPSGPRCGDTIWAKFDNRYQPSALIDQWARLLAHEFGHNMGMSHSRGGVMNPSIASGTFDPDEWRGDPSEPKLTRYFGGEPIDLNPDGPEPPEPPRPPTDPTGQWTIRGTSEIVDPDGVSHGRFIFVPEPRV